MEATIEVRPSTVVFLNFHYPNADDNPMFPVVVHHQEQVPRQGDMVQYNNNDEYHFGEVVKVVWNYGIITNVSIHVRCVSQEGSIKDA